MVAFESLNYTDLFINAGYITCMRGMELAVKLNKELMINMKHRLSIFRCLTQIKVFVLLFENT